MKKNVSGQKIGAQLISATDGSAFSGAVTVYVTGDAGTQAVGSVGGGACTHEGNGYHTYAPAQAETNYDLIAFTFTGTGAVPVTVQVFTGFPQTGDNYARLGAPAGASVSADIAAVKSDTAAILVDTGTSGVVVNSFTSSSLDSLASQSITATVADVTSDSLISLLSNSNWNSLVSATRALTDGSITSSTLAANCIGPGQIASSAIQSQTFSTDAITAAALAADAATEIGTAVWASVTRTLTAGTNLNNLSQADVRTAVGLASANLDTQLDAIPTNSELATAIITGLTTALTEGYRGTGATGSVRDLLYEIIAHMGESSIAGTTKTLKKLDGSTTAKTYTLDSSTTPTAITETT